METLPLEAAGLELETTPSVTSFNEEERIARICLYRSQNVGPVTYRNLIKRYKTGVCALEALPHLAARGGLRAPLKLYPESKVHQELEAHAKLGAHLVVEGEPHYPKALRDIDEASPVLSLHGNSDLFKAPGVAIVGARNCSLNGKKMAYQLAEQLGEKGYPIISGLARGIDGQAHQASLETGTIAVIAGGIDKVYPTEHASLFSKSASAALLWLNLLSAPSLKATSSPGATVSFPVCPRALSLWRPLCNLAL